MPETSRAQQRPTILQRKSVVKRGTAACPAYFHVNVTLREHRSTGTISIRFNCVCIRSVTSWHVCFFFSMWSSGSNYQSRLYVKSFSLNVLTWIAFIWFCCVCFVYSENRHMIFFPHPNCSTTCNILNQHLEVINTILRQFLYSILCV